MTGGALANSQRSANFVSAETVRIQVQTFLDDWHYRIMASSLGRRWNRKKAVLAALDCIAMHGVSFSPEEREGLASMEEAAMVAELVDKLPFDLAQNFDHCALELCAVLNRVVRLRNSFERGDPEEISQVVTESSGSEMGRTVMKLGVIQACKEINQLHVCQASWCRNVEERLSRLQSAAETAERVNQELLALEAQLQQITGDHNDKNKKALMGLADGNDKSLLHTCYSSWAGYMLKCKTEHEIRSKFQKELDEAEKALFDYKEKQVSSVRNAMMSTARQGDEGLQLNVLVQWRKMTTQAQQEGDTKQALNNLNKRMTVMVNSQVENTKKVMARMSAGKDSTLVALGFQAWVAFIEDYNKDKEFNDKVKAAEKSWQEHMAKKKDEAKAVMERMSSGSDSGLMSVAFSHWVQLSGEAKKLRELDAKMEESAGRFKSLSDKQSGNARSMQSRVNEQQKATFLMRFLAWWVQETKVAVVEKRYKHKADAKRQQLKSVQALFSSFSKQLEEGLSNLEEGAQSSGRGGRREKQSRSGKPSNRAAKSESLPDLHAPQQQAYA